MLRRPSRVSHPWRCAHLQPPVAYSPPTKPLRRRGSPFISRVFGSAQPRRQIHRGRQLNTPCITTAVSGGTSFLPSWRKVIQTKSRQNIIFDPGGSKGLLRACPFLGTWRALLCEELLVLERLVGTCSVFWRKGDYGVVNLQEWFR